MSSKKLNLYSCFEESISANNKPLLILDDGSEYNYKILNTLSSQMASFLFKIGIKPGDRVSIQVAKSPEALCLYLACLRAGLVYHPLNPDYKENELEFFINNAAPSVIITDQKNLDVFDRLA
ncbi:MAG: AMP-binding protein, partial [Pseudomonadota bacterium]|nr:AMP-binding protein [Pseudomonadota bacterium]